MLFWATIMLRSKFKSTENAQQLVNVVVTHFLLLALFLGMESSLWFRSVFMYAHTAAKTGTQNCVR